MWGQMQKRGRGLREVEGQAKEDLPCGKWLRTTCHTGDECPIPNQGTKIPHA